MATFESRTGLTLSVILLGCFWSAHSYAQVDNRVDRASPGTTRLHDANPEVGSGGYNAARPGYLGGYRANAIITGDVTGLEGFRGFSPVLQNNRFRAAVPSSSLYDFNARGVGVEDVMAGRTQSPTYFFNPARTISDLGSIRRGLNSPGSSSPASPYLGPQPLTARTGFWLNEPLAPNPQDRRLNQAPLNNTGIVHRPIGPAVTPPSFAAPGETRVENPWFERATTSSIFGPRLPEPAERGSGLAAGALEGLAADWSNPALDTEADAADDVEGPGPYPMPVAETEIEAENLAGPGVARTGDAPTEATEADRPRRISRADTQRLASAEIWAGHSAEDPVSAFAIEYRETVDRLLVEGDAAMRRGDYFKAAGRFGIAHEIDRRNALPLLQKGHALAAAGAYVTSVRSLMRGIERQPDTADFGFDLPAMIDDRDDFDRCRADLDSQLQRREDPELRFLLGYLEYFSDLKPEGLRDLKAAAAQVSADSVIAIFAEMASKGHESPTGSGG